MSTSIVKHHAARSLRDTRTTRPPNLFTHPRKALAEQRFQEGVGFAIGWVEACLHMSRMSSPELLRQSVTDFNTLCRAEVTVRSFHVPEPKRYAALPLREKAQQIETLVSDAKDELSTVLESGHVVLRSILSGLAGGLNSRSEAKLEALAEQLSQVAKRYEGFSKTYQSLCGEFARLHARTAGAVELTNGYTRVEDLTAVGKKLHESRYRILAGGTVAQAERRAAVYLVGNRPKLIPVDTLVVPCGLGGELLLPSDLSITALRDQNFDSLRATVRAQAGDAFIEEDAFWFGPVVGRSYRALLLAKCVTRQYRPAASVLKDLFTFALNQKLPSIGILADFQDEQGLLRHRPTQTNLEGRARRRAIGVMAREDAPDLDALLVHGTYADEAQIHLQDLWLRQAEAIKRGLFDAARGITGRARAGASELVLPDLVLFCGADARKFHQYEAGFGI